MVDAQLPPAMAEWLREQGHATDHINEIGMVSASDDEIWRCALAMGAVLVTKDRDFADWALTRKPAPQVVWVRTGNMSNKAHRPRFLAAWGQALIQLADNDRLIEIR